jgi:hypothetical protein
VKNPNRPAMIRAREHFLPYWGSDRPPIPYLGCPLCSEQLVVPHVEAPVRFPDVESSLTSTRRRVDPVLYLRRVDARQAEFCKRHLDGMADRHRVIAQTGVAPDLPRLTKPFRNADLAASLAALDDRRAWLVN